MLTTNAVAGGSSNISVKPYINLILDFQVRTGSEYLSCRSRNSRSVPCHAPDGNACILPAGIYFLIDEDPVMCNNGLKMIVVSKMTNH